MRDARPRRRRILKAVGIGFLALVVLLATSAVVLYKHFEGNITAITIPGDRQAEQAEGQRPAAAAERADHGL